MIIWQKIPQRKKDFLVIARRVVLPGCSSMAPTAAGEVKMFQRLRTSPVVRADELVIRAAPKSYDSTK
jgi:hypothetical protein